MSQPSDRTPEPEAADNTPEFRPLKRFWPYADLPEQPSEAELAELDPYLRDALFGQQAEPFSITIVFPNFDGPDYEQAVALARDAAEYREVGTGSALRHRAKFQPTDPGKLRDLFDIVGRLRECEVLIDGQPMPYARELWLPLVWFLIPR